MFVSSLPFVILMIVKLERKMSSKHEGIKYIHFRFYKNKNSRRKRLKKHLPMVSVWIKLITRNQVAAGPRPVVHGFLVFSFSFPFPSPRQILPGEKKNMAALFFQKRLHMQRQSTLEQWDKGGAGRSKLISPLSQIQWTFKSNSS